MEPCFSKTMKTRVFVVDFVEKVADPKKCFKTYSVLRRRCVQNVRNLRKKSAKKAFAVSRSAKAVRPKGQQTCEKHVYVLIIRCKFTFSMKSRIELLKRFATRRFCCFRRKTWFSEKKVNQWNDFLTRHIRLSGVQNAGHMVVFHETRTFDHIGFCEGDLGESMSFCRFEDLKIR